MIRIYRTAPDVTTLGPGQRFCIWVQGCKRGCPGCMSRNTWPTDGGTLLTEESLLERLRPFSFEGVTISGGEPMLQCAGLTRFLHLLKAERDAGVIVYTGMTMEQLRERRDVATEAFLQQIDLLIDGNYRQEQDDGGALRGSANQRAWYLTERYRSTVEPVFGKPNLRRQQIQIDDQGVLLVGLRPSDTEGKLQWY